MIRKILPDKERARSIFNMACERENMINQLSKDVLPTLVAENYYEIIKELSLALMFIRGFRTIGEQAHKEILDFLKNYGFSDYELVILQDLRSRRNQSSYEGKHFEKSYLDSKQAFLIETIKRLKKLVEKELENGK